MSSLKDVLQHLNVVAVDDMQSMLDVTVNILKLLGLKSCKTFTSAKSALKFIRETNKTIHLVITDLNMPEMDGIEFTKQLGKINYPGGIVILSSLDQKILDLAGETTRQHRANLIGCLNKPLTEKELIPVLNKIETFHSVYTKLQKSLEVEEIQEAIKNQWLVPYYQPIVNNKTSAVFAIEVLARINKPGTTNTITAGYFIDTAEKSFLIEQITLQIFELALQEYPLIQKQLGNKCKLAMNISPVLLHNEYLPEILSQLVSKHNFNPDNIIIEITEGYAIEHTVQFEAIGRLRIKGFHLGLDDYGTGYTNVQQLKTLPYTEIKIDRSLIYGIHHDKLSQVISNSLFEVFRELNVEIVAEGIEDAEDLEYMNNVNIPVNLQGYIISKPKPLDGLLRWHNSWKNVIDNKLKLL